MKESKNLKPSRSNILVGIYLDEIKHEGQLNECFFGIANQEHPVDVVILDAGLSKTDIAKVNKAAKKAVIKTVVTNEEGNPQENVVKSKKSIVLNIVKTTVSNFPKIFNDIFNIALKGKYEAMSIMEIGDSVGANWYQVADLYMKENDEVGFFLPMIKNWQNGSLSGLMNEACWVEGLSEEAGKFDMNLLLRFNCANPLGGVYRLSELEKYSEEKKGRYMPMKESIKISHYYEFFLRMVYNDVKITTIPRTAYEFRVNEEKVFKHSSSKIPVNITKLPIENGGISQEEASFWMEISKKEYFFDEDRYKTFSDTI